jgi:hypothetical protein
MPRELSWRAMGRVVWLLVVSSLGSAALVSAGGGRPDLAVTAGSVSERGDAVHVTDTIRNVGAATAPSSSAAYFLGSRRIGARAVRALEPHAASRGSRSFSIPASIASGSYRLRVCADGPARIRESSERNNCRLATGRVILPDRMPPTFAGIVQATFCAPGPIGHDRTSRYFLRWERARDDVTPASSIEYEVYEATASGAENFARPTYVTKPGATSFSTPPLPTDAGHYFVVRARDRAGNRDASTVERQAVSICV